MAKCNECIYGLKENHAVKCIAWANTRYMDKRKQRLCARFKKRIIIGG